MVELAHQASEFLGRFGLFVHDPVDDHGMKTARKVTLIVVDLARVQRKVAEEGEDDIDEEILDLRLVQQADKLFMLARLCKEGGEVLERGEVLYGAQPAPPHVGDLIHILPQDGVLGGIVAVKRIAGDARELAYVGDGDILVFLGLHQP